MRIILKSRILLEDFLKVYLKSIHVQRRLFGELLIICPFIEAKHYFPVSIPELMSLFHKLHAVHELKAYSRINLFRKMSILS